MKTDQFFYGKLKNDEYKIIERKFKDNNTYFFIEIADSVYHEISIYEKKI